MGSFTLGDLQGGLSRRQRAVMKGARRTHNDELINDLFGGGQAKHFKDNPMDGETIISAVPQPGPGGRPKPAPQNLPPHGPEVPKVGAGDGVKKAPSLADAVEAAANGMVIEGAMQPAIITGLPGDDYEKILDQTTPAPPNTY